MAGQDLSASEEESGALGTGMDGCPTPTGGMPVELGRQGRAGTERTGGDGLAMATDLAVGGSSPSRRAPDQRFYCSEPGSSVAPGPEQPSKLPAKLPVPTRSCSTLLGATGP